LDGLPVEHGASAKEDADRQSSHHAGQTKQKSDNGRRREPEPLTERGEFSPAGDFQRARNSNGRIGTAGAASMTVE
jgi:hypothetical protein